MIYYVGIDPGSQTGIAAMCTKHTLITCCTQEWGGSGSAVFSELDQINLGIAKASLLVSQLSTVLAIIEKPGAGIFHRPGQNAKGMMRIARNVGQLQERTMQIASYCSSLGWQCKLVAPLRGGTKRKVLPEQWRQMFNWSEKRLPSSHARDAACLARHWSIFSEYSF